MAEHLENIVDTGFRPSQHGFKFVNRFPEHTFKGVCGGMCFAASDLYYAGREVPQESATPAPDSALYRHILARQIDSFGPFGADAARLLYWMTLPDEGARGVWKRTHDELLDTTDTLADGRLVQLYLMYSNARDSLNPSMNHQVLAYACDAGEDGALRLRIYDPNFPLRDDVTIDVRVESLAAAPQIAVARSVERTGKKELNIHGFFISHYTAREPPSWMSTK